MIAREPLIAEPGEEFAYSGAGYLVAGRVAEMATGESFEPYSSGGSVRPSG